MKKFIYLLSSCILIICFTSCGVQTEKEKLVIKEPVIVGNPLIVING